MTLYNQTQKNDLIKAVNERASELRNLFVADNVRMIGCNEFSNRMQCKAIGKEYKGTDYNFLASVVACEMEALKGDYWQWSSEEVIELIMEEYENMNVAC
jgi:hypothetical protein